MLFVQSGALPSLNIQTVGFKRHLLKERGFYLQDSPMFLIIKKKEGRKAHSFFFPGDSSEASSWPLPFVRHPDLLFLSEHLITQC